MPPPVIDGFLKPVTLFSFLRTSLGYTEIKHNDISNSSDTALTTPHASEHPPTIRCAICDVPLLKIPPDGRRRLILRTKRHPLSSPTSSPHDRRQPLRRHYHDTVALFVYKTTSAPPFSIPYYRSQLDAHRHCSQCTLRLLINGLVSHSPSVPSKSHTDGRMRHGSCLSGDFSHGTGASRFITHRFILANPILSSLFSEITTEELNYIISYCAVVAQLEPQWGFQHVFGVSLLERVPSIRKRTRQLTPRWVLSYGRGIGNGNRNGTSAIRKLVGEYCDDEMEQQQQQEQEQQLSRRNKKIRIERIPVESKPLISHPKDLSPRKLLLYENTKSEEQKCSLTFQVLHAGPVAMNEGDGMSDDLLSDYLPHSKALSLRLRYNQLLSVLTEPTYNSLASLVFTQTVGIIHSSHTGTSRVTAASNAIDEELSHILRVFLCQLSNCNARGAAIVSFQLLGTSSSAGDRGILHDGAVSHTQVTRYLERLINGIVYWPRQEKNDTEVKTQENLITEKNEKSKKNKEKVKLFWGTEENFHALMNGIGRWIQHGTARAPAVAVGTQDSCRTTYLSSDFLKGVKVGAIPWLVKIVPFIRDHKVYSRRMQAVFCEFMEFFIGDVVVTLLKRVLHFTISTRNKSQIVMFPLCVWKTLVEKDLRRLYGLRGSAKTEGEDSPKAKYSHCDSAPKLTSDFSSKEMIFGLKTISAKDVWRKKNMLSRSLEAKQFRTRTETEALPLVLYGSIRFLPDGNKLRPISSVKIATASRLVAQIRSRQSHGKPFRKIKIQNALEPKHQKTRTLPNKGILLEALRCFYSGIKERSRCTNTMPLSSSKSHEAEYNEWVQFVVDAREKRRDDILNDNRSRDTEANAPLAFFIKADARRCYDSLPQEEVQRCITEAIAYDTYFDIEVKAIVPQQGLNQISCLGKKVWRTIMNDLDMTCGCIVDIPAGWVVEEPRIGWKATFSDTHLRNTSSLSAVCQFPATISPSQNSIAVVNIPQYIKPIDGNILRSSLEMHTRQHFVGINGCIYKQSIGVAQGSTVALAICDSIFQRVDHHLCEMVELFDGGIGCASVAFRRVDDILVATTSSSCAKAVMDQVSQGWPEVGFRCAPEKTRCTLYEDKKKASNVMWCGLNISPFTLEISPSWDRAKQFLLVDQPVSVTVNSAMNLTPNGGQSDFIVGTYRVLCMFQVRMPITVFCRILNSKTRVLQTLSEAAILWCEHFIRKLVQYRAQTRPHVLVIIRPLRGVCSFFVDHACRVRHNELLKRGSGCPISPREAMWCVAASIESVFLVHSPTLFALSRKGEFHSVKFVALILIVLRRKVTEMAMSCNQEDMPTLKNVVKNASEAIRLEFHNKR